MTRSCNTANPYKRPPSLVFIAVVAEVVASTITPPRDSYDYDYIVVGAG